MSIDSRQLRTEVVRPVLKQLGVHPTAAIENLILGTAAQESLMGRWIVQTNGSALGIYQCEPRTHDDIYINYLPGKRIGVALDGLAVNKYSWRDRKEELIYNLFYATAICYIHYERVSEPLPANNVDDLARYWKRWYNTPKGAGTEREFIQNYGRLVR